MSVTESVAQHTLADALPAELCRPGHVPAAFWVAEPHGQPPVAPALVASATMHTQQMTCVPPRKPISRCFAAPHSARGR